MRRLSIRALRQRFLLPLYDMTRVTANGYFDAEDSAAQRQEKRKALSAQRTEDYKDGSYALAGGLPDNVPDDAPFFVKDYFDYYKTKRGYHARSLNSNGGWNITSALSFLNMPILQYAGEIENAGTHHSRWKRLIPVISVRMRIKCSKAIIKN